MIFNQGWYDQQTNGSWPLCDDALGMDDANTPIPTWVVADLAVTYMGVQNGKVLKHASINSLTVNAGLVALTLVAVDEITNPTEVKLLGGVSIAQPVEPGKAYPIASIDPYVKGCVVFGDQVPSVPESVKMTFSTPEQAWIHPMAIHCVTEMPVLGIGRHGFDYSQTGLINLEATQGQLSIYRTQRKILNVASNVLLIVYEPEALKRDNPNLLGCCGGTTHGGGTCKDQPILEVNGVVPDDNGNINMQIWVDDENITPQLTYKTFTPNSDFTTGSPWYLGVLASLPKGEVRQQPSSKIMSETFIKTLQRLTQKRLSGEKPGDPDRILPIQISKPPPMMTPSGVTEPKPYSEEMLPALHSYGKVVTLTGLQAYGGSLQTLNHGEIRFKLGPSIWPINKEEKKYDYFWGISPTFNLQDGWELYLGWSFFAPVVAYGIVLASHGTWAFFGKDRTNLGARRIDSATGVWGATIPYMGSEAPLEDFSGGLYRTTFYMTVEDNDIILNFNGAQYDLGQWIPQDVLAPTEAIRSGLGVRAGLLVKAVATPGSPTRFQDRGSIKDLTYFEEFEEQ